MNKPQPIDIANFLPHRAPFLMVDLITSLDDHQVTTTFQVTANCILKENQKLTEVGLIENAAQTCSSIVGKDFFQEGDLEGVSAKLIGFISAIKKVEIKHLPKVGEEIRTQAKLLSRFDTESYSICTLECNSYNDHQELLSCEMNLFIQEAH